MFVYLVSFYTFLLLATCARLSWSHSAFESTLISSIVLYCKFFWQSLWIYVIQQLFTASGLSGSALCRRASCRWVEHCAWNMSTDQHTDTQYILFCVLIITLYAVVAEVLMCVAGVDSVGLSKGCWSVWRCCRMLHQRQSWTCAVQASLLWCSSRSGTRQESASLWQSSSASVTRSRRPTLVVNLALLQTDSVFLDF